MNQVKKIVNQFLQSHMNTFLRGSESIFKDRSYKNADISKVD